MTKAFAPSPQSTYWTHFAQDTYLHEHFDTKWHFSDTQIVRKLTFFKDLSLSQLLSFARCGNSVGAASLPEKAELWEDLGDRKCISGAVV